MAFSWCINAATTALAPTLTSVGATTVSGTTAIAIVSQQDYSAPYLSGWSDSYSNVWTPIQIFSGVASCSGSTMTVASVSGGQIVLGQIIAGTGVPAGAYVTAFGTGSGFTGTYTLSTSTSFGSTAVTANALVGSNILAMASYFFLCANYSGGTGATFEAMMSGGFEAVMSFIVAGFTGCSGALGPQALYVDQGYNQIHPGAALVVGTANATLVSMNSMTDGAASNPSNLFTAGAGWTIPTNGTNVNGGTVSTPTMLQYQVGVAAGNYVGAYTSLNYDQSTGFVIALPAAGSTVQPVIHKRRRRVVHTVYHRN